MLYLIIYLITLGIRSCQKWNYLQVFNPSFTSRHHFCHPSVREKHGTKMWCLLLSSSAKTSPSTFWQHTGFYNIVSKELFHDYENLQNWTNAFHDLKKTQLFIKGWQIVCKESNKVQKDLYCDRCGWVVTWFSNWEWKGICGVQMLTLPSAWQFLNLHWVFGTLVAFKSVKLSS